jgi:hypothetical protein
VKQGSGAKGKGMRGTLTQVGFFHTRGETPRHYQFDHSGQFLIVANQDSDTIAVFSFNLTSGEIKYTGNEYRVPSPNFVCCCPMLDRYSDDDDNQAFEKVGYTFPMVEERTTSVPTSVEFNPTQKTSLDLQSELELARKEIAELKKRLSDFTVEQK